MALQELHWRNDKLLDILHSYVMKMKNRLNTYYISLILNAYATLAPDQPKYLADLGPELHDRLAAAVNTETFRPGNSLSMVQTVEDLIPDLTAYSNLWLAITCFGVKANIQSTEEESETIGEE